MNDVLDHIAAIGVVPVVEIDDAASAVPLARALLAGGISTMEVTFRTPAAAEAIRRVAAEVEGFLVGAGTLLSTDSIARAAAAGATYGVAPAFLTPVSAAADAEGLPFVPGVATASEALFAAEAGHRALKLFPAEAAGGTSTLRAFASVFDQLGLRFMPTGGVRADTLAEYAAQPNVFAVGGTWIADRASVAEHAFDRVEASARDALATIASVRAP